MLRHPANSIGLPTAATTANRPLAASWARPRCRTPSMDRTGPLRAGRYSQPCKRRPRPGRRPSRAGRSFQTSTAYPRPKRRTCVRILFSSRLSRANDVLSIWRSGRTAPTCHASAHATHPLRPEVARSIASTAFVMARPTTPARPAISQIPGTVGLVKHSTNSLVGIAGGQPSIPAAI